MSMWTSICWLPPLNFYRLLGKPLLLFYLFQNFFEIFAKLHFSSPTPFCVMNYFFFFGIFLNVFFCPRCGNYFFFFGIFLNVFFCPRCGT